MHGLHTIPSKYLMKWFEICKIATKMKQLQFVSTKVTGVGIVKLIRYDYDTEPMYLFCQYTLAENLTGLQFCAIDLTMKTLR